MSVVLSHRSQLGALENGLNSLKTDKKLMSDSEFSDMFWAVERHHRDLKLAHLTGKAKDLMEQAEKDTKFFSILIKMLCEIKQLPNDKQRESLKKVHLWYLGNRHTLATGPKFGKAAQKAEDNFMRSVSALKSQASSNKKKGAQTNRSNSSAVNKSTNKDKKSVPAKGSDFRQHVTSTRDDLSSPRGFIESMPPPSEPASSRLSVFGNDFMTNRFMMDLPSSKLSWHIESPIGKSPFETMQTPTDWEGPDIELQRVADSSLSFPFDENFHPSHPSVPNSSPKSESGHNSPRSVGSGGSDGNVSSTIGVDVGSTDMVDFQQDVRRRLSRGQTSSASVRNGQADDQSSTEVYGLQKRMVHSIASLVNPYAKLAESEAKRAEEEYVRDQQPYRASSSRAYSAKSSNPQDLGAHIPVLRAVSVSSNKGDNVNSFNGFKHNHLYGQDILSRLNFVGRSGTALDVRYSAHAQGDMPENHTQEIVQLYSMFGDTESKNQVSPPETNIHTQALEDFYQTAENFCPSPSPRFRVPSRIQSAPGPRVKSSKTIGSQGGRTTMGLVTKQKQPQTPQKLGKNLVGNNQLRKEPTANGDVSMETNAGGDRPSSAVKLNTVVNMIDHVKDEMNFFREKLAPTPMSGFRQPSSTNVSSKPLSRPTSTASRKSRPTSHTSRRVRSPSPQGRPSTPTDTENLMMGEPEVPSDTFRHSNLNLTRPHSATVNKAVDWRGKVTPESARIRSKSRMGNHTYVQKLKPSLRTAGASSAGNRPKTAPISMQERWNTKSKECDKNQRIPQAASHTITEINDKDMDQIMNIKYIMGSSDDSRYGSMGDLFLDEEFLRSLNTRYTSSSSLANSVQTKEFVSFVGPTPRLSPVDSRSQSRQTLKKLEIHQIPEESSVKEDQSETAADAEETELEHNKENQNPEDNVIQESDPRTWKSPNRYPGEPVTDGDLTETEVKDTVRSETKDTPRSDGSKFSREVATKLESGDHEGQIHIEVTGLTAPGRPLTPPKDLDLSLKGLSQSDVWQYQPDEGLQAGDGQSYLDGHDPDLHHHNHHHHHHQGSKSFVKPENYCFHCLPDNMSTKVGRSAGRMPGGPTTPSGQVLRMSRRQNEHYKKTPPTRSAPSIPSPHHPLGGRTPGQGQGQQYFSELEHHARKERSPRHYMEQAPNSRLRI